MNSISISQAGEEVCVSGHSFGPAVRDHYLMHFILSGEGHFQNDKQAYQLHFGQGFLIVPEQLTYYEASIKDPWHYFWIGFHGDEVKYLLKSCRINKDSPVFDFADTDRVYNLFCSIRSNYLDKSKELLSCGSLFLLLSLLCGSAPIRLPSQGLAERAREFISYNYANDISVNQIADTLNVNRSHLFRIFKDAYGVSVQRYLLQYRLEQSIMLMNREDMNLTQIAYSCGFDSLSNYSKQFERIYLLRPGSYRKIL